MAETSSIEWTDATWNPITGCSLASPGCTNCYAMKLAGGRLQHHPTRAGLTRPSKAGPVWTGEVRLNAAQLLEPLRWTRRRMIFVCAHGDLFHESVPDAWIDQVFAVMALASQHLYQVLTKRSARMRSYFADPERVQRWLDAVLELSTASPPANRAVRDAIAAIRDVRPLPNVWLGVSVEDQARADERIPDLLATPAAVRWISAEPLLGPVDLHEYLLGFAAGHPAGCACGHGHGFDRCRNYGRVAATCHWRGCECPGFRKETGADGLHWVVVGGESGPGARPMHSDWARALRDQCVTVGVPFLLKQWGAWEPRDEWSPNLRLPMRAIMPDGSEVPDDVAPQDVGAQRMALVGKKAAGRRLDGVLHDAFPPLPPGFPARPAAASAARTTKAA